ncbi:hypothetical protein H632_c1680p0 [Helicosporidium sp. ATCC 50920]|nr:hypothetical protein H632_c1680p0 [Helicosporidium sp. ATCC 50920]|eukprot:KDD73981.1 hypothetical protein H632_c1680p0 [Helicosporidium sp. ATCC 50920]
MRNTSGRTLYTIPGTEEYKMQHPKKDKVRSSDPVYSANIEADTTAGAFVPPDQGRTVGGVLPTIPPANVPEPPRRDAVTAPLEPSALPLRGAAPLAPPAPPETLVSDSSTGEVKAHRTKTGAKVSQAWQSFKAAIPGTHAHDVREHARKE